MFNKERVIRAIFDSLREGFVMDQDSVSIGTEEDSQFVKWCIDSKYISESMIQCEVHQRICFFGRDMLEEMYANKLCSTSLVLSPQALQYTQIYGNETTKNTLLSVRPAYYKRRSKDECLKSDDLFYKVMKQIRDGTAFEPAQ